MFIYLFSTIDGYVVFIYFYFLIQVNIVLNTDFSIFSLQRISWFAGEKGREKKQLLPISSESNESLEHPLLHIFSLCGDVRFSSLWEIYSDKINTHQRVERSSIPNKDAHQSR